METIGNKVRKWRRAKQFTLEQAGAHLGISVSYLSELETDLKPFTRAVIEIFLAKAPDDFAASDFFPSPKKAASGSRQSSRA